MTMIMTRPPFEAVRTLLQTQFGGQLDDGCHRSEDGHACILELAHAACGDEWSARPNYWPDLRSLNDAPWSSNAVRTQHLLPVLEAYWTWADWSASRQQRCVEQIVIRTVREIIAALPGLSPEIARQCREATTLLAAHMATRATVTTWANFSPEAGARAARAARTAVEAAVRTAAEAVVEAVVEATGSAFAAAEAAVKQSPEAADAVLILACRLWIEAAQAAKGDRS